MNPRQTLLAGAIFGMMGVALGAFGAHALKEMLTETGRQDTFELAVRYQFYHALALLLTGLLQRTIPTSLFRFAAAAFLAGIILFSGSLYLICFTGETRFAMVTPVGGLAFIAGWVLLAAGAWKAFKTKTPS